MEGGITNTNLSYFKNLNYGDNNVDKVGVPKKGDLTNANKAALKKYSNTNNRNFLMPKNDVKVTSTEAFYQYQFFIGCVAIVYFGSKYIQRLAKMPTRKKPRQDFQDFIGTIVLATIWFSVGGLKKRSFLSFDSGSFLVYLLGLLIGAGYPVYNYYGLRNNNTKYLHFAEYFIIGLTAVLTLTILFQMTSSGGSGLKYLLYSTALVIFYYLFVMAEQYSLENPPSDAPAGKWVPSPTPGSTAECPSQKTQTIITSTLGVAILLMVGRHLFKSGTGLAGLFSFGDDSVFIILILIALIIGVVIGFKQTREMELSTDKSKKAQCPDPKSKYIIYWTMMGAIVLFGVYFTYSSFSKGGSLMPSLTGGLLNLVVLGLVLVASYYTYGIKIDIPKPEKPNIDLNKNLREILLIGIGVIYGLALLGEGFMYFSNGEFVLPSAFFFLTIVCGVGAFLVYTLMQPSYYTKGSTVVCSENIQKENRENLDTREKVLGGLGGSYVLVAGILSYMWNNGLPHKMIFFLITVGVVIGSVITLHNTPMKNPQVKEGFEGKIKLRIPVPPPSEDIQKLQQEIQELQEEIQGNKEPTVDMANENDMEGSKQDANVAFSSSLVMDPNQEYEITFVDDGSGDPVSSMKSALGNQEQDKSQELKINEMFVSNFGFLAWYLTLFLIKDTNNTSVSTLISFVQGILTGSYVSNFSYYGIIQNKQFFNL